jgi:putative membrane protein
MSTPPALPQDVEDRLADFERMLMEADRIMMQIVQTSLSLIGFGFTINTFFNDVADRVGGHGDGKAARILGVALLVTGLTLLFLGTWSQSRYRSVLLRRYLGDTPRLTAQAGLPGLFTPSFIAAVMLMAVGLFTLGSALLRWLF